MDKDEPLRNKLRVLGIEILSDTHLIQQNHATKIVSHIHEALSFLDIAFALGMISEMNSNILKKEFSDLKQSFNKNTEIFLLDFLKDSPLEMPVPQIQKNQTRIGVQKGSTLMKAISDKTSNLNKKAIKENTNIDILKEERRFEIIRSIKDISLRDINNSNGQPVGVSIKDISLSMRSIGQDRGEKTLQRELVSMVHDGVLKKTGEKRWSRYFLSN
jgi:hypothetical protein